ncbi:hypothetical protein [Microscilla marina]|uniref:Uncharacterized protein n=1 Tax=Microscilla marina ATCC 23134 TaxID=313606 RepID=A1ZSI7_MICM2|nr:hypothetical protein [Microscilla marina]EAY26735.1 hypothetical protein M23134_02986 [Microscilla marina ATCC 23134]
MKKFKYHGFILCWWIVFQGVAQPLPQFKKSLQQAQNTRHHFYQIGEVARAKQVRARINASPNTQYFTYSPKVARSALRATKFSSFTLPNGQSIKGNWIVDLVEVPASFYQIQINTSSGKAYRANHTRQKHYRGVVRGQENESIVSMSFLKAK